MAKKNEVAAAVCKIITGTILIIAGKKLISNGKTQLNKNKRIAII